MSNPKPYFRCPVTLQEGLNGTCNLIVTKRDGTHTALKHYPWVLGRKAVVEQKAGDDMVTVTFGNPTRPSS